MPNEITKVKHPGRQESGKRLVEWNAQNKANLLKNQKEPTNQVSLSENQVSLSENQVSLSENQVSLSENQVISSENQEPTSRISIGNIILGISIIALIGYIIYDKKKPQSSYKKSAVKLPTIEKLTIEDNMFKL